MVDFILKHSDKYPFAKILGMLEDLDNLDKVWFNDCENNVVEALLDEELRNELSKEYGWKIYDIECKFEGKCIEGGVIVSKNGLSKEEILREF